MMATPHALVGAIIASQTESPLIGYLAALISHPLLDLIPHWDLMTRHSQHQNQKETLVAKSLLDAFVGFSLGLYLFLPQVPLPRLLLTMFLAQLPDWLEAPYHVFDWHFPPFSTIKQFQHLLHHKIPLPWGLLPQLLILLLAIYISLNP